MKFIYVGGYPPFLLIKFNNVIRLYHIYLLSLADSIHPLVEPCQDARSFAGCARSESGATLTSWPRLTSVLRFGVLLGLVVEWIGVGDARISGLSCSILGL